MKDFGDVLSRMSWLVLCVCFLPTHVLIFRPTWKEFLVYCAAEWVAFWIVILVDRKLFLTIHPRYKEIFPKFEVTSCAAYAKDDKSRLFALMSTFPARRALYCALVSYLKALIPLWVVIFYWKHDESNFVQAITFLLIESVMYIYFYIALYIELHDFASQVIARIHQRYDWSDVFQSFQYSESTDEFPQREQFSLVSIGVLVVVLQSVLVLHFEWESKFWLLFSILAVSIGAVILVSRIWWLSKGYVYRGLQSIYGAISGLSPAQLPQAIALHSSSYLGRFEKVYNMMIDKLRSYDRELSNWFSKRAEESRYLALGEISGIVVHDLSGPLHVVRFCIEQLLENPAKLSESKYTDQINQNLNRATDLINSLRGYLRQPNQPVGIASLGKVCRYVLELLESQHLSESFYAIQFHVSEKTEQIYLTVPPADLTHIIFNLFNNSAENLISHTVKSPKIELTVETGHDTAKIYISDNGTGLPIEIFSEDRKQSTVGTRDKSIKGLGLILVKRLVERNGGSITLLPASGQEQGTRLLLEFPTAAQKAEQIDGGGNARKITLDS